MIVEEGRGEREEGFWATICFLGAVRCLVLLHYLARDTIRWSNLLPAANDSIIFTSSSSSATIIDDTPLLFHACSSHQYTKQPNTVV